MTTYLSVRLHPKVDGYIRKDDLERELSLANLLHLMPSEKGARRAFTREIKSIEEDYGVKFQAVKDTPNEIMWSIYKGKSNLGTYMVVYLREKYKNPTWIGAKPRVLDKTRDKIAKQLFDDVVFRLNDTLTNHAMNSYSLHLKVKEWLDSICEMKLPRSTFLNSEKTNTEDYLVKLNYINQINSLARIYSMAGMSVTITEVEV